MKDINTKEANLGYIWQFSGLFLQFTLEEKVGEKMLKANEKVGKLF